MKLETTLIHEGEPRIGGAVTLPIFQSSTYTMDGEGDYHSVRYIRLNNTPNHLALHEKLRALEGTEAALVTASGMAAIATLALSFLSSGDHVLCHRTLYGGTYDFFKKDLPRLGIQCDFVDADDPKACAVALRKNTRMFYVEALTNPLLDVVDLPFVVGFCQEHGLLSVIDSTLATPVNLRPAALGFDLIVHSATKYLNGHSDLVAGVVAGRSALVTQVKKRLDHLGGSLDPHAAWLLTRGLKTLALRVRHQNGSAQRIAEFLAGHPAVSRVHYPGLKSHRSHERAKGLLSGMGGLLSFELHGGLEAAEGLLQKVRLPLCAPSLGGPETLMTRPVTTSHAGLSKKEQEEAGISPGLVRMSVGFEATEDLIADLAQAFDPVLG